jgi:hypothetical protein
MSLRLNIQKQQHFVGINWRKESPLPLIETGLIQRIKQVISEIENFSQQIDQAKNGGTILNKITSLSSLKNKVLDAEKLVTSLSSQLDDINTQKDACIAKIKSLEHSFVELPLQGEPEQASTNPTQEVQAKEKLTEQLLIQDKKLQQIQEFEKIIMHENMLLSQALTQASLTQVQAALAELDKITIASSSSDFKVEVSLKNLMDSSKVIKTLYKSGMTESTSNELFLKFNEAFDPEDIHSFLNYFQSNEVELTGDNIIPLFQLANQYEVKPLLNRCFYFLKENTSWDQFPELLQMGIEAGQPELTWIAVNLAMKEPLALEKLEFQSNHPQTNAIINDLKELAKLGTLKRPIFHQILGKIEIPTHSQQLAPLHNLSQVVPLSVDIQNREVMKPETSVVDLQILSEQCPLIEHLTVAYQADKSALAKTLQRFPKLKSFGDSNEFFTSFQAALQYQKELSPIALSVLNLSKMSHAFQDDDLKKFSENFKNLKQLLIKNSKIKSIPFESLEYIDCHGCTSLTSLHTPYATTVCCHGCTALASLNAPYATTVRCIGCTSLASLDAPYATTVYCSSCTSLTSLHTPYATTVYCNHCTSLTSLHRPYATTVGCHGCTSLASLNAPNATTVGCIGCTSLASFVAPNATTVDCSGSTALASLNALNATTVDCSGCTSLASLVAPYATWVDCSNCTSLTSLHTPYATTVGCHGCTALASLVAPNATTVYCRNCRPDIILNAPKYCKIIRD